MSLGGSQKRFFKRTLALAASLAVLFAGLSAALACGGPCCPQAGRSSYHPAGPRFTAPCCCAAASSAECARVTAPAVRRHPAAAPAAGPNAKSGAPAIVDTAPRSAVGAFPAGGPAPSLLRAGPGPAALIYLNTLSLLI